MFHPSSATSASSLVHMLDCDPLKPNTAGHHLYLCQPHTIQIIQLVEATPPPRCISSVIRASSAASSSYPSTSDSDQHCSSYCSSIVTPDDSSSDREPVPWTDDTYNTRMRRVHAWRDAFIKATSSVAPRCDALAADAHSPSLKRKTNPQQADDDSVSHTSKRSRSRDGFSISRLVGHPCPACDTLFADSASLREHAHARNIPEACRVAVEYNFEPARIASRFIPA